MHRWLLALPIVLLTGIVSAAEAKFEFKETSPTGLELDDGGRPVFVYNFGPVLKTGFPKTMARSSYISPVWSPDGTVLTDDFNKDHPHHRGIFWAWMEISVDGKKGDIWTVKGTFQDRFVAWKAKETSDSQAKLDVENGWFDGERKFVSEKVGVVVHPVDNDQRMLDFTLAFEAVDQPVTIIGTSEGNKGYGGFAMRFAPRDGGEKATVITTDKGSFKKDGILSPHPWAQVTGPFNGKPEGARIDDDPSNPGYPRNGWLLRHGFGLLNVSYPGLTPVTLEKGKPLVLKYKVTLLSGAAAKAEK